MENWNLHPEYESEAQIHELKIETNRGPHTPNPSWVKTQEFTRYNGTCVKTCVFTHLRFTHKITHVFTHPFNM